MNPRTIIFLVVALVIAGGTGLLVKSYMNAAPKKAAAPKGPPNEILVAKRDLVAGSFLTIQDIGWEPWPKSKIAKAYLQKGKKIKMPDMVGAVVRYGIAAGEPITEGRVTKRGDRGFMAAVLSPGMRAISIKASQGIGASGFLFPGDRVDVLMSHSVKAIGGGKPRRVVETILEDLRVLAVDQIVSDNAGGKVRPRRLVTVELTPKQVEFLTVASKLGQLSLSLRSLAKYQIVDDSVPDEKIDPNDPNPPRAAIRGRTYTGQAEVSRLIGGVAGGIDIVRGTQSKTASTSAKGK